jgi:hypothetical protein
MGTNISQVFSLFGKQRKREQPMAPQRQPRVARRCPVSHSIGGVEARLDDGQGWVNHGLLWDLSRHGACVILEQQASYGRGQELLLILRPSMGVNLLELPSCVCWSEPSGRRVYVGLQFRVAPLPSDTFLEWIITSC